MGRKPGKENFMIQKNNFSKRIKALIGVVLVFVMVVAMSCMTFAIDENYVYYETWDEYKEANGIQNDSELDWQHKAEIICDVLDYAVKCFEEGDLDTAYKAVNNGGYYGYYEITGFERTMNGVSGARVSEVELQFKTTRKAASTDKGKTVDDIDEFKAEVETLKGMLREDALSLDGGVKDADIYGDDASGSTSTDSSSTDSSSSTSATALIFTASFSIILREGFEAILIVGAIIAYLQVSAGDDKKEKRKKAMPVYIGSLVGIVASFGLAWLLNAIKLANTASQEIIEGVTALLAVCVLYYVSNWMLSKSETDAWVGYIKKKTTSSSGKGSMFALAFTAFLAVFREGAEVVLFYQPYLSTEYADYQGSLWAGFIIGAICLVIVYLIIHFLSVKLPIKPFFTATSILMFIMSISFLGAGIKELIEGDVIDMTSPTWLQWIPSNDVMEVLGIYPVLETLIPQLILLIVTIVIFVIQTKKNRKIHAEAEARRAAERAVKEAEEKKAREEALTAYIKNVVNSVLTEKGLTGETAGEAAEEAANLITDAAGDVITNAGDVALNS